MSIFVQRLGPRWSWALYDFANSAYVLLIVAFAFPLFFRSIIVGERANGDLYWGLTLGISVIAAGVLAPFVGSWADARGTHRTIFRTLVCLSVSGTLLLPALPKGQLLTASSLFVATNVCFNLSIALYDSFLRRVSAGQVARVSGFGWGIGYVGGILCLLVLLPWIRVLDSGSLHAYRIVFIVTGLWYFIFSLPFLGMIPKMELTNNVLGPLQLLGSTLREGRRYRHLFLFLGGYFLLSDATGTLTNFSSLIARDTLHFSSSHIAALLLYVQIIAVPATILSGRAAERWGAGRIVIGGGIGWMIVCAAMYFARTPPELYTIATIIGLVIGSTYSAARTLLAELAPHDRTAQAFGLNAFSGRISETVAPMVFGVVSSFTGSQRLAIVSMLPFLATGVILIWFVPSEPVGAITKPT